MKNLQERLEAVDCIDEVILATEPNTLVYFAGDLFGKVTKLQNGTYMFDIGAASITIDDMDTLIKHLTEIVQDFK